MEKLWLFAVLLLDCLPFTYFLYIALKGHLKHSLGKWDFPSWLCSTVVACTLFFLLVFSPSFSFAGFRLIRLLLSMSLLGLVLLTVKKATPKALFVYSLIIPFSLGFAVLSSFIAQYIPFSGPPYMVSSLVRLALIILTYPVMIVFWRRMGRETDRIRDPLVWRYLWPVPASAAFSEILLFDRNFEFDPVSISGLLGRIVVWFGSVAACFLIFFLANRYERRIYLEKTNDRNEMLLELQRQQYAELAESIEQTRAARHDLRHHLNAMSAMLEDKSYAELESYLEQLVGSLPSDRHIKICENYAANAILDNYIRKAAEANIAIKINFRLSNSSGISDGDLCVLLGNAVENAIENASTVPDGRGFISINALEEQQRIYMTFDNNFDGELIWKEGVPLSRKRGFTSSGLGITSIKTIVKKYDGDIKLETDGNLFKLSVMITKALKPEEKPELQAL